MNERYYTIILFLGSLLVLIGLIYSLFIRKRSSSDPKSFFVPRIKKQNELYKDLVNDFTWSKFLHITKLGYKEYLNQMTWTGLIFILLVALVLMAVMIAPKPIADTVAMKFLDLLLWIGGS